MSAEYIILDLSSELFSGDLRLIAALLFGGILAWSMRIAPWRWIFMRQMLHLYLGATLTVSMLWHVRAQVEPTVTLHLIGATTLTLMFGWSLAILSTSLALVALTANGRAEWEMFAFNGLINGVVPVTLSQLSLLALRTWLPRNFFLYVLGNGFLTAGLSILLAIGLGLLLLWSGGIQSGDRISSVYLPFLPLMFFPEAFLNGWIVTTLACYRPQWIYSFSDEHYLKGK